jgi:NADP-dependent 3-hydroxy acid dehydrogenase YdfG
VDNYYAGRVAVVTGAGSGIGQALAVRLARAGTALALLDIDGPAAEDTALRCRDAGALAHAWAADVTDHEALAGCAAAVADRLGRASLLFCVAGVIHTGNVLASRWDAARRVVEVNLLGAMGSVDAFLPALAGPGGGHVVLLSSGFGLLAAPRFAAYSASKFGVRGYAEALAQEMALGGTQVRVTCAYPGVVRTSILRRGTFADGEDADAASAGFDRLARTGPDEAAESILRQARQGRARALVGMDARAAALAERAVGGAWQRVAPKAVRIARGRGR